MRPRVLAAAAGLTLISGLALMSPRAAGPDTREASPVILPESAAHAAPAAVAASPAPRSGLGHASPPDPEALRDAPHRQAVYDAEAKPGEFVTPPNVSIEH